MASVLHASMAAAALLHHRVLAKDLGGGWEEKQNEEGKMVQQLKIEAPAMTEEDQYGYVMPDRYRCDSCKAVMFHLDADLRRKQPKSRRLQEWEYTDVFDATCSGAFGGYGIKLIDGENALSGPGLPQESKLAPGSGAIQMSSETWSKRLGELCREIVYEKLGEEDVYEKFHKAFQAGGPAGLNNEICTKELRQCEVGPKKPAKKEETSKEKAEKKAKKEKAKKDAKAQKEKKEKKAKAEQSKAKSASGSKIDFKTFLSKLAESHGLSSDAYASPRTQVEWEKLTVNLARGISNRHTEL